MRGLLILSNGVEDIEALGTRDLLKRADIDIDTATFEESLVITTSYGLEVKADLFGHHIHVNDYDFLIVPGGPYVATNVDQDTQMKELITAFNEQEKLLTAICAGPRFLGQIGLLDGKNYTAFRGSEQDSPKGQYHPKQKAVVDGRIITARGAGALYEFAYEITAYLLGEEKAIEVQKRIMY